MGMCLVGGLVPTPCYNQVSVCADEAFFSLSGNVISLLKGFSYVMTLGKSCLSTTWTRFPVKQRPVSHLCPYQPAVWPFQTQGLLTGGVSCGTISLCMFCLRAAVVLLLPVVKMSMFTRIPIIHEYHVITGHHTKYTFKLSLSPRQTLASQEQLTKAAALMWKSERRKVKLEFREIKPQLRERKSEFWEMNSGLTTLFNLCGRNGFQTYPRMSGL